MPCIRRANHFLQPSVLHFANRFLGRIFSTEFNRRETHVEGNYPKVLYAKYTYEELHGHE